MKITVTGRNFHITDDVHDHLNRKMIKTITDLDDKSDILNSLFSEKYRHFAEFTVKKRGLNFHSHHDPSKVYPPMDKSLEKMMKQLRKHKGKPKELRIKKPQI
tara:strand:- start:272 stop:580 length:309 start_codon:yes stop_codon:yes gene_type:complete